MSGIQTGSMPALRRKPPTSLYSSIEQNESSGSNNGDAPLPTPEAEDANDSQVNGRSRIPPQYPLPPIRSPLFPKARDSNRIYEEEISQLKKECEEQQQCIDELTGYLDQAIDDNEQLKKQEEDWKDKLEATTQQLENEKVTSSELAQRNNELQGECAQWGEAYEALNKYCAKLLKDIEETKAALSKDPNQQNLNQQQESALAERKSVLDEQMKTYRARYGQRNEQLK